MMLFEIFSKRLDYVLTNSGFMNNLTASVHGFSNSFQLGNWSPSLISSQADPLNNLGHWPSSNSKSSSVSQSSSSPEF